MAFARIWRTLGALFLVAAACAAAMTAAWAEELRPVPALTARVIDQTGSLTPDQAQALEAKLAAFEQRKGSQIVVLMVPATAPEDIAAYANRVANTWKIGRRTVGDGVLVLVAKDERRMRIEVAKTLEGAVPDLAAARIIDQQMKPAFRANDFAGGLDAAVDQLAARIGGEALPEEQAPANAGGSGLLDVNWEHLAIFLFFFVAIGGPILRTVIGSKLGAAATGGIAGGLAFMLTRSLVIAGLAGVVALLFTLFSGARAVAPGRRGGYGGGGWSGGSSSGGGWSGGSSSGGGFSSGGGGDFGGGGASGDW